MSPVVTVGTVDTTLDEIAALERAWHGPSDSSEKSTSKINSATLTVIRNGSSDFQDRQVYLYVDGELWGKVRYGRPMSREIPPGHHKPGVQHALFTHRRDRRRGRRTREAALHQRPGQGRLDHDGDLAGCRASRAVGEGIKTATSPHARCGGSTGSNSSKSSKGIVLQRFQRYDRTSGTPIERNRWNRGTLEPWNLVPVQILLARFQTRSFYKFNPGPGGTGNV
jgi:hypothetical protein